MVGFYNFTSPSLIVLEPDLVKTVLQTKFASFHENGFHINPDLDPLLANNPFFNYGDKWVSGRKQLTYAFSSMRLKILLEGVKQVCEKLEHFLDSRLNKVEKLELELKDLFSRYTAQVVAGVGFGVEGFCFDDERKSDSFHEIGKSFLDTSVFNNIIFSLTFLIPSLAKVFKMRFVPKKIDHFFRTMVVDIMMQRRTDRTPKNDFLHLMAELERMEGDKFDINVLASHAMSFFVDGYETSSGVLRYVGYQLADHPEVQEKLREEVMTVLAKYDGTITYEALREMTYMDQVINETQRVLPVLACMKKICTETCELKGSDGLVCQVEPQTEIIICAQGLQEDSRYWENPEVFDPERFSLDKKNSINKYVFLPFGEGPRMCVGMRMAMLQMKACLATLLRKYRLELSPRTQVPLKLTASSFLSAPVGGIWAFIRPV